MGIPAKTAPVKEEKAAEEEAPPQVQEEKEEPLPADEMSADDAVPMDSTPADEAAPQAVHTAVVDQQQEKVVPEQPAEVKAEPVAAKTEDVQGGAGIMTETGADGELMGVVAPRDDDEASQAAFGSMGAVVGVGALVAVVLGVVYYRRSAKRHTGVVELAGQEPKYMPVAAQAKTPAKTSSASEWGSDEANWEDVKTKASKW